MPLFDIVRVQTLTDFVMLDLNYLSGLYTLTLTRNTLLGIKAVSDEKMKSPPT